MIVSYADFTGKFLRRNNVIKISIMMYAVMAALAFVGIGFVFYYLGKGDDNVSNYIILFQVAFIGINQFFERFFSFISSFYIDFENRKISLHKFLDAFYQKSLLFFAVLYLLPSFLFIGKENLFFKLIELALLNMGVGVFLMLCLSALFSGYVTMHTKQAKELKRRESVTMGFFIMWVLAWLLFALDDYLVKEIGSTLARTLIIGVEIAFILLFKMWIPLPVGMFLKRRYRKLALYFSV